MIESKTAFVASTLPAGFLKGNLLRLQIKRIVCSQERLSLSYLFLKELYNDLEIVSVPSGRREIFDFLISEIATSPNGIITFHECCWLNLDLAILKLQPKVLYFPGVTLASFRKITSKELSICNLLHRLYRERSKDAISFLINSVKYKRNFDFYETPSDGGGSKKEVLPRLKESSIKNLTTSFECLNYRKRPDNTIDYSNDQRHSKNVILIMATDVVSNSWQEDIFRQISKICTKKGFNILVKQHPNPALELNLSGVGQPLPQHVPFEVLDYPYLFKIGLFSTTLTFEPEKSISIANLFQPMPDSFPSRKSHLLSIPGGEKINFISSIKELEMLLETSGSVIISSK